MKAAFVYRPGGPHRRFWGLAFLEGLERHGFEVQAYENFNPKPVDLLVIWGIRNAGTIRKQKEAGGEVCVLERGYIGDREKWTSVSFGGGLNNRGTFRGPLSDGSRWENLWSQKLMPWKEDKEGYALLLGQVPTDSAVSGAGVPAWYVKTTKALIKKGIEVRFRPHPLARNVFVHGAPNSLGNLQQAFSEAAFALTWNSNSALDAVIAGVPTITADPGAMAWDVTGHDVLEFPPTPDRTAWCHKMAWCQYNEEELRSGFCWDQVKHG